MTRVPAIDSQLGRVAVNTVAHCGNTTRGQYAFTLIATDVFAGWTVNRAIKNEAARWVAEAMAEITGQFTYPIHHVRCDNGSDFLSEPVTAWADTQDFTMTRSRLCHSNDSPFAEQKNGDILRRTTFTYRHDTDTDLALLRELWPLVNLRKNLFRTTKEAISYRVTKTDRHMRAYDIPRTPADRVKDAGILISPTPRAPGPGGSLPKRGLGRADQAHPPHPRRTHPPGHHQDLLPRGTIISRAL
ncbi:hypothetical protein [Arthrobacter sp. JSM 101049]|uniref:hypothetical protein n=1 Tax=Arthrobacter sp. JSM 101049 TaxID=929097 RepID=UPI003563104D